MTQPYNEPDKSPATQNDQPDTGPVKSGNGDGNPGAKRDLSQGSEPETRGTSGGR